MRVMCIDSSGKYAKGVTPLVVGEVYTVTNIVDYPHLHHSPFYQLEEKDPDFRYTHKAFAPLSDIDETTFVREYDKQKEIA